MKHHVQQKDTFRAPPAWQVGKGMEGATVIFSWVFLSVPYIGAENSPLLCLVFGADSHRAVEVLG